MINIYSLKDIFNINFSYYLFLMNKDDLSLGYSGL